MTAFRYGIFVTITYFAAGFFIPLATSWADDIHLRKAATPSNTAGLTKFGSDPVESDRSPYRRSRIGLSPVPYVPQTSPIGQAPVKHAAQMPAHGFPDLRGIIRKVNPSVVSIRMLDSSASWSLGSLGFSGDPGVKALGYGSGFIVSRNGLILTNEHVLRNGTEIEVELLDGRKFGAKVLFKDGKNDLALLRIGAVDLQPVVMGDSDGVELGEWVVGIGNPYGIGQSIMLGIVSAQKRRIPGSGYPPLIQIDAAMNLGNSGGPLFNMDGEVIGINTILLWKSQGIGFATPINVAKTFLSSNTGENIKAAAVSSLRPIGPVSNQPRNLNDDFNPLAPPWNAK
ncbi:MAG: trypsin-like peptidase domain-containing protein [Desulfomonilaceae bacterium]|nr:trypsin-like peptidase domain-containing protein [Desulfomonilaceae bacterium]